VLAPTSFPVNPLSQTAAETVTVPANPGGGTTSNEWNAFRTSLKYPENIVEFEDPSNAPEIKLKVKFVVPLRSNFAGGETLMRSWVIAMSLISTESS